LMPPTAKARTFCFSFYRNVFSFDVWKVKEMLKLNIIQINTLPHSKQLSNFKKLLIVPNEAQLLDVYNHAYS
jgi:hypothetical protein